MQKVVKLYMLLAGVALLATALAKLISSFGRAYILRLPDPIFMIPYKELFRCVAILELTVAFICLFTTRQKLQAILVAWLSSGFLLYRIGLIVVDYHKPCNCLGTLTGSLHIPEQVVETVMKVVLVYLLIGSYGILCFGKAQMWIEKRV